MENCKFVDEKNLIKNFELLKSKSESKNFCAVLKSNAYGHDLETICSVLGEKLDFVAVLNVFEAKIAKKHTKSKILMLEKPTSCSVVFAVKNDVHISITCLNDLFLACSVVFAVKNDVHISITCLNDLFLAEKVCKKQKKELNIHIKLNTGLNRLGLDNFLEFLKALHFVEKSKFLKLVGVFTHCGSGKCARTEKQLKTFFAWTNFLPKNIIRHFANSSVLAFTKQEKNQMARVGMALFGYGNFKGLLPVLSVYSKIIAIKNVKKGEFLGYGNKHKAKKDMQIAVLSIGYFDGLFRSYAKKGFVLIDGKKAKIVAEICMNMTLVDITNQKVSVGDFAVVLGKSGEKVITAEHMAKLCKTSTYEVLTAFSNVKVTKTKPVA